MEFPHAETPSSDEGGDTQVPARTWSTLGEEAVPLQLDLDGAQEGEERRERLRLLLGPQVEQR